MRRTILGIIILSIGTMMMLRTLGISDFEWFFSTDWKKYIVPGAIILVGIKLLFTSHRHTHENDEFKLCDVPEMGNNDRINISASFTGNAYDFANRKFRGAKINAFMGGVKLDLRDAIIDEDCTIEIHTLFGGADIQMPKNVNVVINSNCLIGGVSNHLRPTSIADAKTIRINANCFFGGVDLKD